MNDNWVRCSKIVVNNIRTDDQRICDHEDWLDYLNLHETSWLLFAWGDRIHKHDFGWPSKKHE